jgi:hypothetical protein
MIRALLTVLLLTLAACKSGGGNRGGYSGPPQWEGHTHNSIVTATRELSAELKRPLEYDLTKRRLTVKALPTVRVENGHGVISTVDGDAWGRSTPGVVMLPDTKARIDTLTHEVGHVVLWAHGISGDHHKIAPKFFNKYNGTKGAYLP